MPTNNPTDAQQGETLLPCPFCGRRAIVEEFRDGDDPQPLFVATCEVCPVKTYDQFTAQEAARIWNTRAAAVGSWPMFPQGDWQHVQIKAGNPRVVAIQFETAEQATEFINTFAATSSAESARFDLDPLEFWCDLAEVLGHPRPQKVNPASLVAEVNERLAITPAGSTRVAGEQEIGPLQLYDRADGVKGHFCVGRKVTGCGFDYNEFWNKNKFCSAGEVFIGKEAAEAKLNELSRPSARRAAEEISSTFGLRFQEDSLQRTAAIISKHFAASPSNRARRAAMELSANGYIDRDLLGEVSEQRLQRVIEIINRVFAVASVPPSVLDEIEAALVSIADGVSPQVALGKAFNVINAARAAAPDDNDAESDCTCDDLTEVQRAQGDHYDDCPHATKGDR